ncbi:MAG: ABC transporter substrate-binding protein [Candidatus Tectomicrobia bacterium]|nr:ABC transporter substrate-binding protein [Candidatus Tectomicrobia bacterium]
MARRFFGTVIALLFLVFSAEGIKAEAADKVSITVDWILGGYHSGLFAAQDRGNFARAGLEVAINRGFGSLTTVKQLGAGTVTFGFADMGALVIGRSRGTNAKALAVILARTQYAFFTLKDTGVRRAKDMEGKTWACPAGSVVRAVTPALFLSAQVDANKVKTQVMDAPMMYPSLLAGKVDLVCAFWVDRPALEKEAKRQGKEVVDIAFADYGIDAYSNSLMTSDARIEKQPDLVRRFVKAALEGLAFAIENPERAVDLFLKHQPSVDRNVALGQQRIANQSALTPTAKEKGLGYILEEKVTSTRDILTKYMKLEVKVPVKDLYTNAFLPSPGIMVKGN